MAVFTVFMEQYELHTPMIRAGDFTAFRLSELFPNLSHLTPRRFVYRTVWMIRN